MLSITVTDVTLTESSARVPVTLNWDTTWQLDIHCVKKEKKCQTLVITQSDLQLFSLWINAIICGTLIHSDEDLTCRFSVIAEFVQETTRIFERVRLSHMPTSLYDSEVWSQTHVFYRKKIFKEIYPVVSKIYFRCQFEIFQK